MLFLEKIKINCKRILKKIIDIIDDYDEILSRLVPMLILTIANIAVFKKHGSLFLFIVQEFIIIVVILITKTYD